MEEWRGVVGWADLYEVSDLGRVRSLNRKFHRGRILRPVRGGWSRGYLTVVLSDKAAARKVRFYVHRLVALAFIPNSLALPEVNHLNGIKTDNMVGNLEWVTALQNGQHASRLGLMPRGERRPEAKLTELQVIAIRVECENGGNKTLVAARYGISPAAVALIVKRINWRHVL